MGYPGYGAVLLAASVRRGLRIYAGYGRRFEVGKQSEIRVLTSGSAFIRFSTSLSDRGVLSFPKCSRGLRGTEGANTGRSIVYKRYGVGNVSAILYIVSPAFVVKDVNMVANRGVAHTFRCTARGTVPVIIYATTNNTEVRRNVLSLVRVTGASNTMGERDSTNGLCVAILASPAANNIATSFTVRNSVVLTRPSYLITFTNPEMVRRAVHRGLPGSFRASRFILRGNFVSSIIDEGSLGSALMGLLGLRNCDNRRTWG